MFSSCLQTRFVSSMMGRGEGQIFLKGTFGKKVWDIFRKIRSVQDLLLSHYMIEGLNPKITFHSAII